MSAHPLIAGRAGVLLRPGVRYNEHVSTYHSFYGTADVSKVSFNVLQKDGNMVDKKGGQPHFSDTHFGRIRIACGQTREFRVYLYR